MLRRLRVPWLDRTGLVEYVDAVGLEESIGVDD